MKPLYTIVVFVTLLCCSMWAGMHSYRCAEEEMVADMNQALAQTLRHKQEAWITPDTIRDYRSNLRLAVLRRHALLCYAEDVDPKTVASNKMTWGRGGRRVAFRGYANCSVASVLALSDQRMPLSLFVLSLAWLAGSLMWMRRRVVAIADGFGGLRLDEATQTFYDEQQEPVHFTAMQRQLMLMFFADEHHSLRKEDICGPYSTRVATLPLPRKEAVIINCQTEVSLNLRHCDGLMQDRSAGTDLVQSLVHNSGGSYGIVALVDQHHRSRVVGNDSKESTISFGCFANFH